MIKMTYLLERARYTNMNVVAQWVKTVRRHLVSGPHKITHKLSSQQNKSESEVT